MQRFRAGQAVRVEAFVTRHINGLPQATSRYVTASSP
jgi:hypothetical protein